MHRQSGKRSGNGGQDDWEMSRTTRARKDERHDCTHYHGCLNELAKRKPVRGVFHFLPCHVCEKYVTTPKDHGILLKSSGAWLNGEAWNQPR